MSEQHIKQQPTILLVEVMQSVKSILEIAIIKHWVSSYWSIWLVPKELKTLKVTIGKEELKVLRLIRVYLH